ncbi:hypothetical protein AKO1_004362 [Acrasis kona]|uniref:RING-type domain-containing protein n=1 Tax=Acrasis kona TaxID=1008807 RepID=A0AAW2Z856_9EUKA
MERQALEERKRTEQKRIENIKNERKSFIHQLITKSADLLFEQLSDYLITRDCMFTPTFIPDLNSWMDQLIKIINNEMFQSFDSRQLLLQEYSNSPNEVKSHVGQLVQFWWENEFDQEDENQLEEKIIQLTNTLHSFLNLSDCILKCNAHKMQNAMEFIFTLESKINSKSISKIEASLNSIKSGELSIDQFINHVMIPSSAIHPTLSLRFLTKLFQICAPKNSNLLIEYCSDQFPHIREWNVKNVIDSHFKDFDLYTNYLITLYYKLKKNKNQDSNRFLILAESLQELSISDENGIRLNQMIFESFESNGGFDLSIVESILKQHKQSNGLLYLYELMNRDDQIIEMLTSTRNLDLLTKYMNSHSQMEHWKSLIKCCNGSNGDLNIEHVICIMCKVLGTSDTLKMIHDVMEFELDSESNQNVNVSIYRKLLELSQNESEQCKLRHELLETYDSYMWSERDLNVGPQIRSLMNLYRNCNHNQDSEKQLIFDLIENLKICKLDDGHVKVDFEQEEPLPVFYEDYNVHWGLEVKCSVPCPVCKMNLDENVGGQDVIVFKCGHAYHQYCLSLDACAVCYRENLLNKK